MNKKQPKLKFEEDKERTATRSPPKKEKVEQTQPRKKLKLDADSLTRPVANGSCRKSTTSTLWQSRDHPGRSIPHDKSPETRDVRFGHCPVCGSPGS